MKRIMYLLIFTLFLASCGEKKEVLTEDTKTNSNTGVVVNNIQEVKKEEISTGSLKENTGAVEKNSNSGSLISKLELKSEIIKKIKKGDSIDEKTQNYISVYNMDNLEKDIKTPAPTDSGDQPENYIQYLSQIGSLNKVLFLKFFDNIKKLNLNDAKKTFEENDLLQEMGSGVMVETVSPFYPTCCSSMVYMTTEVYKNGLFGMSEGGQAENDYTFYYLTSYKNFLVEFTFSSQFSSFADGSNGSLTETISYGDKKILETPYKKGQNISSKYMKDLFLGKKTQPDFTKELEKAKKQIDDLYN